MIFFKDRHTFRTYKQVDEKDHEFFIDSYEDEGSSAALKVGDADQDDTKSWIIWNGRLFLVSDVSVNDDGCDAGISDPLKIFDRDVIYSGSELVSQTTTSGFVFTLITKEWIEQDDEEYRIPYMQIHNNLGITDPVLIRPQPVKDALDDSDSSSSEEVVIFNAYEYFCMLRDAYGIRIDMFVSGDILNVNIYQPEVRYRNVIFGDGDTILDSQSFGEADTVSKVTVVFAGSTPEKYDFYLNDDGEMSAANTPPIPRVKGQWTIIEASADSEGTKTNAEIAKEEAEREFGENSGGMKIEFRSSRLFDLGDVVTMRLNKKVVKGKISSIKKRSDDKRWQYIVGDLATSLTDKLKKKG